MIEQVLPLAHVAVLAHHAVVMAVSKALPQAPAVHTLAGAPGLLSGTQLGNTALGQGSAYSGLNSVTSGISSITADAAHFGDAFAGLGILWGGLVHTHVFHNERAPEQSKTIVKGSIIGLGTMLAAPVLVSAISSL